GQKLGRQLGAPTANVQLKRLRAPLNGVYRVSVELDGVRQPGVANIGARPTVEGDGRPHLEVHLLDFSGDLYGRRITVVFHEKLRDEQRFDSLQALQDATKSDFDHARARWAAALDTCGRTMTDYKATLNLPATDSPKEAGLPTRQPKTLKRLDSIGIYQNIREVS